MKVKDLLAKLSDYNPELEVVMPGYHESYIASEFKWEPIQVVLNIQEPTSHLAPHEKIHDQPMLEYFKKHYPDKQIIDALLLDGTW